VRSVSTKFRCAPLRIKKALVIFGPLSRDYNCDSTTIRLYDPTTTYRARLLPFAKRREQKMNMSFFRRSRVVVVS